MQKGMQYSLEGSVNRAPGVLNLSCEQIEITLQPGALYEGSFAVYANSGTVQGYIVSTDRRMECVTEEFIGNEETIDYCFHGTYLEAGKEVRGEFLIISSLGEYPLPFSVHMEAPGVETSRGEIRNLNQFAALAKTDWGEAVKLFYSREFSYLLKGNDRKYTEIYRGLSARPGNQQNLEEFLIACGKKQAVIYRMKEEELVCDNPGEMVELSVTVYKECWGYTRFQVVTEGDFVFTEKEVITDDDFLGNQCVMSVYIDNSLLHLGRNFGCVRLTGAGITLEVPVKVLMGEGHGNFQAARLEKERILVQLMEYYQHYRLKKMAGTAWLEQTGRLVERLVAMNDQDVMARLFQAQLLIFQERQHEGSWVLTHALELMEKEGEEDSGLMAYYLYLTTLVNRDREYVRQVASQVEDIYRKNRTSWKVAWFLLFLSPDYYRNDASRWNFLERQFKYGCTSPIWYLESLLTLNSNPALLRKLGEYEIQVLYFGTRKEMLSEDLKEQFLYLAGRNREFSPVLLRLLILCYQQKADDRILQEICAQLVKGGRTDREAYPWYALGVERELRITRLYEYYVMSMDLSKDPTVSRKALMYFTWHTNMDYEHTAYLYYYLLSHRQEYEDLAEKYKERMEHFVVDQILKEHINRHLAYLYQELLKPAMFSPQLADCLSRLLFAHTITVDNSNISGVLVYRPDIASPTRYQMVNGSTWAALYSEKDTVILEDTQGNRYVTGVAYKKEKLMNPVPFLDMTAMYVTSGRSSALEFDKYLWDRSRKTSDITPDVAERGRRLVQSEEVSDFVKGRTWMRLLREYRGIEDVKGLDVLLQDISWEVLDAASRCEIINNLILRGKLDKACDWLGKFGPDGVETANLVRLCNWMIRQNGEEENDLLTDAAAYAFRQGKYDGEVLAYLGRNLRGSVQDLNELRKALVSFEVNCYELCGRLLRQMLFTGVETKDSGEIFRYYLSQGGTADVTSAFLRKCAYEYLAEGKEPDPCMIREIGQMHKNGEEVKKPEKLAYLKYAAEKGNDAMVKQEVLQDFLKSMLSEGIRLNFFRKLSGCEALLKPWADKTIVECQATQGTRVTIHFCIRQENGVISQLKTEEMKVAAGGIYFREFVLFFGETLQYYFTMEQERQKEITQTKTVHKEELDEEETGKFHMLNEIIKSGSMDAYERMDRELEDMYHNEYLSIRLFTMR